MKRDTRFKLGVSGNQAAKWKSGQSGNPAGKSKYYVCASRNPSMKR
jgi:hypothetical protein